MTSVSAIGWVGIETHFGAIITGNRSTRATIVSKPALPLPTTIGARSVVTGTAPCSSVAAVSARLRRCGERSGRSSPRPPR
jgi:hypothetical protein